MLNIFENPPDEWKIVNFGSVLIEGTRTGIYKPKQFHGTGIKMINMGELFANPRLKSIPMERIQLTEEEEKRFDIKVGDLIFARRSLVAEGAGKCSIVCEVLEPTTFESSIIRARPDPEIANSFYLFYLFNSPIGRYLLGTILRHVAVAGITGSDLVELKIPLPPLPIQNKIVEVLSPLDDKIELNRQINKTLEALARTIFQSWFVDFDPVRANAEGRQPEGMDAATAALFPSGFEEIEGGEVPKGWGVGTLGDVADNIRRPTSPDRLDPDTPYIGLEHMPQHSIALDEWGMASSVGSGKFAFKKKEFLFGKLRPYFHKVGIAPIDGVCSTDILVINPKKESWYSFVICAISRDVFVEYTNLGSDGTKMPRTNWSTMEKYPISIPPEPVVNKYNSLMNPVFERIVSNIHKSRKLAQIRDALLPKLMSGEIDVKNIKPETPV